MLTTDPQDPALKVTAPSGMQEKYLVLSEAERAKGFVRPVRTSYKHVGERPKYPTRELTEEEHNRYDKFGYVLFEQYPEDAHSGIGRYWTNPQLTSGCGTKTTMGQALSETYARDPKFYGATFCCGCGKHLPVAEFVWAEDGETVGS